LRRKNLGILNAVERVNADGRMATDTSKPGFIGESQVVAVLQNLNLTRCIGKKNKKAAVSVNKCFCCLGFS